jgi:hypothetical protein
MYYYYYIYNSGAVHGITILDNNACRLHNEWRQWICLDLRQIDRLVNLFVNESHDSNVLAAHDVQSERHCLRAILCVHALYGLFEHAVDVLIESAQLAL